jgi:cytochrome c-type biogenesis protein
MSFALIVPFVAGTLSFLSPCVLPLIPGYLSFLAGTSLTTQTGQAARWRVSQHALWFVGGCAIVFILLGAGAAMLGMALNSYQIWLERIGGALLIVFALVATGWVTMPFLSQSRLIHVSSGPSTWWRSTLIGMAFGLSWSACTGPVLAGIVTLTVVQSQRIAQGVASMLAFAVGQGLPIVLLAVFVDRLGPILRRLRRFTAFVVQIGAALLIAIGLVLISGQFNQGFE